MNTILIRKYLVSIKLHYIFLLYIIVLNVKLLSDSQSWSLSIPSTFKTNLMLIILFEICIFKVCSLGCRPGLRSNAVENMFLQI